jgi:hypothetical protein
MAVDHDAPKAVAAIAGPKKVAASPEAILAESVTHLQDLGAMLAGTIAPHLGVAIHGVQDAKGNYIIASRAIMAGNLLRERVKTDVRLLRLLLLFNRLFEVPEGLQLAGSVVAAVAVDTGRISPDVKMQIPIMGKVIPFEPVRALIGDVVDYVAANSESAAAEPAATAGANPNGQKGAAVPEGMAAT